MRSCTLLLLMALPLTAAAEVYRWVDEKGQVHYSQTPPAQRGAETVAPAPPPSAAPNQEALNEALEEGRTQEQARGDEREKGARDVAQRQERCNHARGQLAQLENAPPVRLMTQDEQGNVSRMTEEEYERRLADVRQAISENCG